MSETLAPLDLDEFYDEAFPNDPYLSAVVRVEIERMWAERAGEREAAR